ncbi:MAG: V-type ATP synthase subunit D [Spirochaetales bacterium]|nr:V-type ATP synthase subunit D [Spirochaetales bacterium]
MRQLAPTRTNLLKVSAELNFARLGYELLDQKRNILILELMSLIDQATQHQDAIEKLLTEAYKSLEQSVTAMGRSRVRSLATAVHIDSRIAFRRRKVMGVSLPVVETEFQEFRPYFSLEGTSFHIDEALSRFKAALEMMGKLAELKVSITRLAGEIKKTVRKVNALEKIAIPDLAETKVNLENRLEETERDMFVLMKMVKRQLLEKRREDQ